MHILLSDGTLENDAEWITIDKSNASEYIKNLDFEIFENYAITGTLEENKKMRQILKDSQEEKKSVIKAEKEEEKKRKAEERVRKAAEKALKDTKGKSENNKEEIHG